MPKFRIKFGLYNVDQNEEIIEVESLEEAQEVAYEAAMGVAEGWLISEAEEISDEEAEEN
ncbi:hypothetical protein EBZ39_14765 [bacterium]|nr:hypothetical protein [bacterium]